VGYISSKLPNTSDSRSPLGELPSRFERHTQHCHACREMHQRLQQMQWGSQGAAVLILAIAIVSDDWIQVLSTLGFVLLVISNAAVISLKKRFELTHSRV
jgi:hypothetical protein